MSAAQSHLGVCLRCGYDLGGRQVGERCPECSAVIVENPFRGGWRQAKSRRRFVRGSRCLVAATGMFGITAAMGLLAMLLPQRAIGDVLIAVADFTMMGAFVLLLAAAIMLAFAWRAIAAVRVLVTLIVLLSASSFVVTALSILRIVPTEWAPILSGCFVMLLAATIAISPIYLARSSGRPLRFAWLPLISAAALVALAAMALTLTEWGTPYDEFAIALAMVSQFGTAASYFTFQRSVAVALRDTGSSAHA